MSHIKATLLMVFIGFFILIVIVSIFYGILIWNKSKNNKNQLEMNKLVLNVPGLPI